MCIHLFNPPAPGCEPETSGRLQFPNVGRCGRCRCLPHHWQIDVSIPLIGNPVFDPLFQMYAGRFVLKRTIPDPAHDQAMCTFLSEPVPIEDTLLETYTILNAPPSLSLWQLVFDYNTHDQLGRPWENNWALFAGGFYGDVQPTRLSPDSVEVFAGINMLDLDEVDGLAFATYQPQGAFDLNPAPFRCLHPNVFEAIEGLYQANFPAQITIKPFWP